MSARILATGSNSNASKCFPKVTTSTYKWDLEIVFCDVIDFVGRGQHFTLVDIINPNSFQDLR